MYHGRVAGASFSNDPNFQKISAGAALAGAGTIAVDDFMTIRNRVQDSSKYDTRGLIPDNHILSSPVNIPPNLFLKRFAVFYIPPETKNLFYTKELRLTGAADTLNLSFKTNFAPVPIPRKARCEPGDLPILFRRMTIGCLADCERMHPFNRKSCVEAYKRQHPED